MKAFVQQRVGDLNSFKWEEKGSPKCAVDFCDYCGDCLHCFTEDPCPSKDGKHIWVIYKTRRTNGSRDFSIINQ